MPHNEVKGSLGGGGVGPGIVYVLGQGEPSAPGGLVVVNEDAEVLFEPLVCSFELAICLGVVGEADILFDV